MPLFKRGDDDPLSAAWQRGLTVYAYDDAAVVTGGYRENVELKRKNVVRHARFTDTWIRQNAAWKCATSQSTLVR